MLIVKQELVSVVSNRKVIKNLHLGGNGYWVKNRSLGRANFTVGYREAPADTTKRRSNSFDSTLTTDVAIGWLCPTIFDSCD